LAGVQGERGGALGDDPRQSLNVAVSHSISMTTRADFFSARGEKQRGLR
jgi:hypothetical protein